jgi:hypothetical protein
LAPAGARDLVHAHPAVGRRGDGPLGLHELLFEQTLERRIERSFFDLKQLIRALLNVMD